METMMISTIDRLKTLGRSTVLIEISSGIWKKVIGPAELLSTLPFGGTIKLGLKIIDMNGTNMIFGGKSDITGKAGHYTLNDFDMTEAKLKDVELTAS